jgi:hypothetical protein
MRETIVAAMKIVTIIGITIIATARSIILSTQPNHVPAASLYSNN